VESIEFFYTYAPVVNWTTVCHMLILSLILGFSTKQVDYILHAPIDVDPNWEFLTETEKNK